MSEFQPASPPPTPVVPPTQPSDMYIAPRPSSWPKVIGIISIVLGSLGLMGACWGVLTVVFLDTLVELMEELAKNMPPGQPSPADSFRAMDDFKGSLAVSNVAMLALAGLLLYAGIQTARRQRVAMQANFVWAVLKILFALGYAVLSVTMLKPMMEQATQQVSSAPGMPTGVASGMAWKSAVFTVLWYCAYPVFILIWFSRTSVKTEVATWP